jgi:hypothetical protein
LKLQKIRLFSITKKIPPKIILFSTAKGG